MENTNTIEVCSRDESRKIHRFSLIAGLIVVVLTVLAIAAPMRPCGTLATGYNPVLAFELARSVADLHAIFGTSRSCRSTMIASMETSIWIDTLLYIPAYGAFIAFLFLGWRDRTPNLSRLGVYTTMLAVLFDYIENLCMMQIMAQLDRPSLWSMVLPWVTGVKWIAIGLVAGFVGLIFVRSRSVWRIPAALICIAALGLSIAAMAQPAMFAKEMGDAIGASWLVYLIAVAFLALRPRNNQTGTQVPRGDG